MPPERNAAAGPGGAGGPARPGASAGGGPSWATGGLNFDVSGIKTFTAEIKKAASAVTSLFKPFKDLGDTSRTVDSFFAKLKKHIGETSKLAVGLKIEPTGGEEGGAVSRSRVGGDTRMPSGPLPSSQSIYGSGAQRPYNQLAAQFRMGRGGQIPPGGIPGVSQTGALGGGSIGGFVGRAGLAIAGGASNYVNAAMPRLQQMDLAAYLMQQTAGQYGRGGYLAQYNAMRYTMPGAFWGGLDRAQAAQVMFNMTGFGANTALQGGGNVMQGLGQLSLADPRLSGADTGQIFGGLMGGRTSNALLARGIRVSPGGTPRSPADIFNQISTRLFRGNTPTPELLQYVSRQGTPGNVALTRMLGGDQELVQSYLGHLRAQVQLGRPLNTDVAGYQSDLKKAGITNTLLGTQRNQQDIRSVRDMTTDQGVIDVLKTSDNALAAIDRKMADDLKANQKTADLLGKALGVGYEANRAVGFLGKIGGGLSTIGGGYIAGRVAGRAVARSAGGAAEGEAAAGGGGLVSTVASRVPVVGGVAAGMGAAGAAAVAGLYFVGSTGSPTVPGQNLSKKFRQQYYDRLTATGALPQVDAGEMRGWVEHGQVPAEWWTIAKAHNRSLPGIRGTNGIAAIPNISPMTKIGKPSAGQGDPWPRAGTPYPIGDASPQPQATPTTPQTATTLRGPGRTQGMRQTLVDKLRRMFTANPKLVLTSGFRTTAEQTALFQKEPGLAAPPGRSNHERGLAGDVSDGQSGAWLSAHAKEFGLVQPMPGKEPWHLEEPGAGSAATSSTGAQTTGAAAGAGGAKDAGPIRASIVMPGLDSPLGSLLGVPTLNVHSALRQPSGGLAATTSNTSNAGTTDKTAGASGSIPAQVFAVGRTMGASPRVLLAAFEAGIVESNMQNLPGGDRDSAGVFQQRPSQGWGTYGQVTNVEHAATEFYQRAMGGPSGGTAGSLAQAVQRSAAPGRYDQARPRAVSMLANLGVDVSQIAGDPVAPAMPSHMRPVRSSAQPTRSSISIQNLTVKVTVADGSFNEATKFVKNLSTILSDEQKLRSLQEVP